MYLCIDTTSQEAGITLVGKKTFRAPMDPLNSSEQIFEKIDEVMKKAKIEPADLTGVFVIKGPGSFTGLRVGIAVANQFAHQLKIPIVGVTTDEWWSNRSKEKCIYLQTMNRDEIYAVESENTPTFCHPESASGGEGSKKWFGQVSDVHRQRLSKGIVEITALLSPEETWEAVVKDHPLKAKSAYDLVEPYYGKEAKITERKAK
jgi:tRNA threonylcarbamoyl adenosine modification protein YeaZ